MTALSNNRAQDAIIALRDLTRPDAQYCFGRAALLQKLKEVPLNGGAALLIGGIMSGKTTILQRLQAEVLKENSISAMTLPVYLDLRSVPQAESSALFDQLLQRTMIVCQGQIEGFASPSLPPKGRSIDSFAAVLAELFKFYGHMNFRLCFLFDNADKLSEYPAEVRSKLLWLLDGDEQNLWKDKVSILFAGGQKTRPLLLDGTSAPGGWGSVEYVQSLAKDAILEMLAARGCKSRNGEIADLIIKQTGGHAGLSSLIIAESSLCNFESAAIQEILTKVSGEKENYFVRITDGLSREAHQLLQLLIYSYSFTAEDAGAFLHSHEINRWQAGTALHELESSGIGCRENDKIVRTGAMYWKYIQQFKGSLSRVDGIPKSECRRVFRRCGEGWWVQFDCEIVFLFDRLGLRRYHYLLQRPLKMTAPGEVFHVGKINTEPAEQS